MAMDAHKHGLQQYNLAQSLANPYCMLVVAEYALCALWVAAAAVLGIWHADESIGLLLVLGPLILILAVGAVLLGSQHVLQRRSARSLGYMIRIDADAMRLHLGKQVIALRPSDIDGVSFMRNRAGVTVGIGLRFSGQFLGQSMRDGGIERFLQHSRAMRRQCGFDFFFTLGLFESCREFAAFNAGLTDLLHSHVDINHIAVPARLTPTFLAMEPGPRWWRLLNWTFGVVFLSAMVYAIIEVII